MCLRAARHLALRANGLGMFGPRAHVTSRTYDRDLQKQFFGLIYTLLDFDLDVRSALARHAITYNSSVLQELSPLGLSY